MRDDRSTAHAAEGVTWIDLVAVGALRGGGRSADMAEPVTFPQYMALPACCVVRVRFRHEVTFPDRGT